MSQDTFARIMGLAAVVFLIYALVLGLEAVLGRELLPGPGVYDHEVRETVPLVEMGSEAERRSAGGAAADHARERPGPPARTKPTRGKGVTGSGSLDEVASASVEAAVAEGLRSVERLHPVSRLPSQPLDVLGE